MISDKVPRRRMITVILVEILAAVVLGIGAAHFKLKADSNMIVTSIITLCLVLALFEGLLLYIHSKESQEKSKPE